MLSVGTASAGIGLLSWVFVRDPHYRADGGRQGALPPATAAAMWRQLVAVLRVPTFAIIVVQVRGEAVLVCERVVVVQRAGELGWNGARGSGCVKRAGIVGARGLAGFVLA